ncbi:invasion associated locus B family protein [Salinisphaera sp. LB1]|uniref:invasion associated locus B family protein n=1 Tax=Salinisphaera sp. LB1 TaxID=2183911 RepID=UPI000D705E7E|nr:invasion associated locus B family protein [Salinisphaera sp. LB1]AWN17334.1 Invasion associated family protein [Salinisphaera sp. LB1]
MSRAFRFSAVLLCAASLFGVVGVAAAQNSNAAAGKSGQNNVKITHYDDWEVRCPKSGKKNECEMTQLVKSPDSGKPIMRVVMGYPPQINTAAMIFILPLGTRLAPGVQLSVDGDQPRRFPFQICLEQGCRADFPIKNSLLNKLKHGHTAQVTIVGPKGDQIKLKVSLSGFTDANNAIAQ